MPDYSDVAVLAVSKVYGASPISPRMAWANAAAEVFPNSVSMQVKGCPRTTFLTLCASGVVKGVPGGPAIRDSENARHAQDCLKLLAQHPSYVTMSPRKLWNVVTHASGKTYNQQMHVVLGLAQAGLLRFGVESTIQR